MWNELARGDTEYAAEITIEGALTQLLGHHPQGGGQGEEDGQAYEFIDRAAFERRVQLARRDVGHDDAELRQDLAGESRDFAESGFGPWGVVSARGAGVGTVGGGLWKKSGGTGWVTTGAR